MLPLVNLSHLVRPRRLLATGVAATVVYALIGFVVVPAVIERQLPQIVADSLDREAVVEQVRLNPFALSLSLRGFELRDIDGSRFAAFEELLVNFQLSSVFRRAFTFDEIRLVAPEVHVKRHADGSLNLPEPVASEEEEEEADTDGAIPPVIVRLLSLQRGAVSFTDASHETEFEAALGPIDVTIDELTTRGEREAPYSLVATRDAGERLEWTGTFGVDPLHSTGTLKLSGIRPRLAWQYLQDELGFEVADGRIDLAASYELDASGEVLELVLSDGAAALDDLRLTEKGADEPLISVPAVAVDGIRVDLAASQASIASITSRGAELRCWLEPDGTFGYVPLFTPAPRAAGEPEHVTEMIADEVGDTVGEVIDDVGTGVTGGATVADDEDTEAAPWSFRLDELALTDYTIEFEDRTTATPARVVLDSLALTVGNVTTAAEPLELSFDTVVNGDGHIKATGTVATTPPAVDLDLDVDTIALDAFQPYVDGAASLDVTAGSVSLAGSMAYREPAGARAASGGDEDGGAPMIRYRGGLAIDGLRTVDRHLGEDFVTWGSLTLEGLALDVEPTSVEIERIAAREPSVRIIVAADGTTNVARLAGGAGDSPAPASATAEAGYSGNGTDAGASASDDARSGAEVAAAGPDDATTEPDDATAATVPVSVGEVSIAGGAFDITDLSVEPRFAMQLGDLDATIAGLSSQELTRADVDIRATLNKHAPMAISGQINPLSDDAYTDLTVTLRNVGMSTFTPYSGKYVGQAIEKGKLSLALHYRLSQSELIAENGIVLDQFSLGRRVQSDDATSLPVGLALALLKDTSGKIDLDVPVRGNVDDPAFTLTDAILDALVNLLTKVATSPFALVGGLVGGSGDDLSHVTFAVGRSALAADEATKLETLAGALAERPALRLEVMGAASTEADMPALRSARLESRLKAARFAETGSSRDGPDDPEQVVLDDEEYMRELKRAYDDDFGEKPRELLERLGPAPEGETDEQRTVRWRTALEQRMLERILVGESDLRALARERGTTIRDHLVEAGVAADRVFVLDPATQAESDGRTVRTELMLAGG